MKFKTVIENNKRLYLITEKSPSVLNGAIGDLQQGRFHEFEGFEECLYNKKDMNGLLHEAYAIQYLDEEHIGIYLGAADIYIDFYEAPEDQRLKIKTADFLKVVKKWQEEEAEYNKDPEAYKEAIERGEKVFDIPVEC